MEDPNATTGHFVMLSVPEAAAEAGVPEATLRRWIADGTLSAITIGRTPMVNVTQVATLRDRRHGRTRGGLGPPRPARVLAGLSLVAGLAAGAAFLGWTPIGSGGPWWLELGLGLAGVLIGLALWRAAATSSGT